MRFLRRAWEWFDARTDASKVVGPIMRHPVPPRTGWMYVFGSATLLAFLIQVTTGIALATAYVSSAGQAYASLQWITHQAFLGHLLRGMHYFGASAMVLLIGIHAIRIGDNVGEHTILFSTLGETLELTHRAHTRDCYARGALQAAKFLAGRPPGRYTMNDVLGI